MPSKGNQLQTCGVWGDLAAQVADDEYCKKSLEVNECELGAETPAQLFISGGSVPLQSLGRVTAVPVFCLVSPTPAKLPEGQEEGLQGEK